MSWVWVSGWDRPVELDHELYAAIRFHFTFAIAFWVLIYLESMMERRVDQSNSPNCTSSKGFIDMIFLASTKMEVGFGLYKQTQLLGHVSQD